MYNIQKFHIPIIIFVILLPLFKGQSVRGINGPNGTTISNTTQHLYKSESNVSSTESKNNDTLCVMKKGEHIYDLSSLSSRKFWSYMEPTHNDSTLLFLLSVCHPVQYVSTCKDNNGVCFSYVNHPNQTDVSPDYGLNEDIVLNDLSFTSAGKLNNQYPEIPQEGTLTYVYKNGAPCIKGNKKQTYQTEIHFLCAVSAESESAGPVLMASPKCLFIFTWITLAACPKKIEVSSESDPCITNSIYSEYPLNLHTLNSKTFYKSNSLNNSFEINICGPIQNGSCTGNAAICDTSNPENPQIIATSEKFDLSWKGHLAPSLVLSYKAVNNAVSAEIFLSCDRTAFYPRIYFTSKLPNVYHFSIYTINVCPPHQSDCIIRDEKLNSYDLRSLHKKQEEGNWEVIGINSDGKMVVFNLNICGPINPNPHSPCPAGPVGACLPGVSVASSTNLGYITSKLVANKDGSLTLMYTGGDSCKKGVKTSSTRITFLCNPVTLPPVFLRVTDSCEHLFQFKTPAACPMNLVTSHGCTVTDPLFGHTYDLTPLRANSSDMLVTNSNEKKFRINICGPLLSPCAGRKESRVAVCELGAEETSGGEFPAELAFNDGTLTMKFENGAPGCGGKSYASQILFSCSHEERGLEGLQYLHADESTCIHHFIWHTRHACPPHQVVDCSVRDGNYKYDLNALSNPNTNEVCTVPDAKYFLNVCRSVIHSKESRCAYSAGACRFSIEENQTINLGEIVEGPYVDDGELMIKYENGDICSDTRRYSTIIYFECTHNRFSGYPILIAVEDCQIIFEWETEYACPQEIIPQEENLPNNCTAINSLTNYVFDMTPLKSEKPKELTVRQGVTLLVSICGNITDPRCHQNNTGSCMITESGQSSSGGVSNQRLKFHMWSTYLEYKGGERCSNGMERSTQISFICHEGGSVSGPVFIDDDQWSCVYFVNWYTDEACERHISCFAHSWKWTYDLSTLIRVWGNYEVTDPRNSSSTFLLNVCRPLNPVIGVNCHPGSSICLVRKNEEPLGLGHPILNPTAIQDQVHLMYTHGSNCPGEPGYYSSRIIFVCNRTAGAGSPEFLREEGECQTQFEWHTALVCPPAEEEGQCQIAFEAARANVDLMPLRREEPYRVSLSDEDEEGEGFLLNVCGATVCDNVSAVCTTRGESYGRLERARLRWDGDALVMSFHMGTFCQGAITDSHSTHILFKCDPEAGLGVPKVAPMMKNLRCMAIFEWKTNLTCMRTFYPPSEDEGGASPQNVTPPPHSWGPYAGGEVEDDMSQHTWVSVLIVAVVLVGVGAAFAFVGGRSNYGRRMYARMKRTLARKGYATAAENDTLLQGETAYVYRVDEDEQVLRV